MSLRSFFGTGSLTFHSHSRQTQNDFFKDFDWLCSSPTKESLTRITGTITSTNANARPFKSARRKQQSADVVDGDHEDKNGSSLDDATNPYLKR
jgi:hypothetical protein